jgi:hypothetical protein
MQYSLKVWNTDRYRGGLLNVHETIGVNTSHTDSGCCTGSVIKWDTRILAITSLFQSDEGGS